MAKKTKELTLEEKLEQALVPKDEWSYEVPENWCFFRFTSLIDVQGGTQPPKSQFVETKTEGYIRLVQIRDFATDKYAVYVPDTKQLRHFNKNDIMIARYGASLGRICTGLEGAYNVALAKTIFSEKIFSRRYVFWMLQSESFQVPLTQISRTAQVGFNKDDLNTFAMPLPPLVEQHRIVNQIEILFAKLDEAKRIAEEIVNSFELRKSAILHKAFTGELTAQWRKEHGFGMESWSEKTFDECIIKMQNGLAKRSGSIGKESVVLRLANLADDGFDVSDLRKIILNEKEQLSYFLKADDVIMIRVNGSKDNVGKQFLVTKNEEWAFCDHIIRIKYDSAFLLPAYMVYVSKGRTYRDYIAANMVSSAGQNTISRKGMANLIIQVPTIPEQEVIIAFLDSLFVQEQQAKEAAEAVLGQIDTMKKAILARAFRGELGTNNETEESSIELLKKILV